jgi:hypothetical protein
MMRIWSDDVVANSTDPRRTINGERRFRLCHAVARCNRSIQLPCRPYIVRTCPGHVQVQWSDHWTRGVVDPLCYGLRQSDEGPLQSEQA